MALIATTKPKPTASEYINSMQGNTSQSKPTASQYIRDMGGGSKSTQGEQYAQSGERQYIITLTGGRKYTLSQGEVDWIRNKQSKVALDYYDADDEDQMRKANGELPRAFLGSYRNTKVDSDLYNLGLPSAKYLDQYVAEYDAWYGGGQTVDFGSSDAEKAIKSAYQKSWEYDYTPEDQQRKAQGLMPAAFEASYADSYFDSDLFKRGLPSSKKLGDYVDQYNANVTRTNRVNEFYAQAAFNIAQLQASGVENDGKMHVDAQGNSVSGSDLWKKTFYDTLVTDYADLQDIYKKRVGAVNSADYKDLTDYYEAVISGNKKDTDGDVYISFDDFNEKLPALLETAYSYEIADKATRDLYDVETLGDAVKYQQAQADKQAYAAIKDLSSVKAFINDNKDASPAEILNGMSENGVKARNIRQARNYLVDQIAEEEEAQLALTPEAGKESIREAYQARRDDVDALFEKLSVDSVQTPDGRPPNYSAQTMSMLGKLLSRKTDAYSRNSMIDEWADGWLEDDGRTILTVEDAEKISDSYLDMIMPGRVSSDSFKATLNGMKERGASAETILTVASRLVGNALMTTPAMAALITQIRGAAEALERAGVVDDVPFVSPIAELEAIDAIRDTTNSANARRLQGRVDAARERANEAGVSDFEFDQMLRRKGLDALIQPESGAKNYFIDVDFMRTLDDTTAEEYGNLPAQTRKEYASAAWDALDAETKAGYVENFAANANVNPDLHKQLGKQLEDQVLGKIFAGVSMGILNGAINLADMSTHLIGNRTDRWGVTKIVSDATARVNSLGTTKDQSLASDLIGIGTTVAAEIARMYALHSAGSSLTSFAAKASTKGLGKVLDASLRMIPFVSTAMGGYYDEAMQSNANISQATMYAVVCGTLEGALESLSVDQWVGKGMGREALAKRILTGGKLTMAADAVTKWKAISLVSGFLGEFTEESASYAASYFMQRATYNKDAQFSVGEMLGNGVMGGIIGLVGSGLSLSSRNASNIAYEFAAEHGYTSAINDAAFAVTQVETMPEERKAHLAENPVILPLAEYNAVQRDIAQHTAQKESQKAKHAANIEKINAELKAKQQTVAAYRALQASLDTNDPEQVKRWGKISGLLRVAESELDVEQAQHAKKLTDENSADEEVMKQHDIAIQKAMDRLDSHNVGVVEFLKPELEEMRGGTADPLTLTERVTEKLNAAKAGVADDYQKKLYAVSPQFQEATTWAKRTYNKAVVNLISGQYALERATKAQRAVMAGSLTLDDSTQMVRNAKSTANYIIEDGLINVNGDVIGESFRDLVRGLPQDQAFQDYLAHLHNIDRMSLNSRAVEKAMSNLYAFEQANPTLAAMEIADIEAMAKDAKLSDDARAAATEALDLIRGMEKAQMVQNKPVLGRDTDGGRIAIEADESRRVIEIMDAEHADYAENAKRLNTWWRTFKQKWMVDPGLITQETSDMLDERYPNYVPTYRVDQKLTKGSIGFYRNSASITSPISVAKGSTEQLQNIYDSFSENINRIVGSERRNELLANLYNFAEACPAAAAQYAAIVNPSGESAFDPLDVTTFDALEKEALQQTADGANVVSAYINGQKVQMHVSSDVFQALDLLMRSTSSDSEKAKALDSIPAFFRKLTNPIKSVTTGYNPLFGLTNAMRDLQTSFVNTKASPVQYWKNIGTAADEMFHNSERWQTFKALGGDRSGFLGSQQEFTKTLDETKLHKVTEAAKEILSFAGEKSESLFRFAEYINGVNTYGDDADGRRRAIMDAADVTVNFSRSGAITKAADSVFLYLNAGVQGLDKMARQIQANPKSTAVKASMLGALGLILRYLGGLDDNPHYENLTSYVKDNNYIIPNVFGKRDELGYPTTFIKLPKSREYGVLIISLFERTASAFEGDEDAFYGYSKDVAANFKLFDPLGGDITAPVRAFTTNKNYYGADIVPQSMLDEPATEQKDAQTSVISTFMSERLSEMGVDVSPMHLDYIADQYGGFVSDFVLPATAADSSGIGGVLKNMASDKFIADPLYSSGVVSRFYDRFDEAKKAAGDAAEYRNTIGMAGLSRDENAYKMMDDAKKQISALRKQERELLASELDTPERKAKIDGIRSQINEIAAQGIKAWDER